MARPAGFEPATTRLEGGCSIRLSYGRLMSALYIEQLTQGSITVQYKLLSFRFQLQAVLGKRDESYRDPCLASTTIFQKNQSDSEQI